MNYFKIKYEITRDFYLYLNYDKLSPELSADRCYNDFRDKFDDDLEYVITISTIIGLLATNKGEVDKKKYDDIKKVIFIFNENNYKKILSDDEYEYLEDDIRWLKDIVNKIQ